MQPMGQDLLYDHNDSLESFLDPDLLVIVKMGLTAFLHDCVHQFHDRFQPIDSPLLQNLITQQTDIRWDGFLWGPAQYQYAKQKNLVDESKKW